MDIFIIITDIVLLVLVAGLYAKLNDQLLSNEIIRIDRANSEEYIKRQAESLQRAHKQLKEQKDLSDKALKEQKDIFDKDIKDQVVIIDKTIKDKEALVLKLKEATMEIKILTTDRAILKNSIEGNMNAARQGLFDYLVKRSERRLKGAGRGKEKKEEVCLFTDTLMGALLIVQPALFDNKQLVKQVDEEIEKAVKRMKRAE